MQKVEVKLRAGMAKNGVAPDKIEEMIRAISSFVLYGFPESHAISFAILSYASAYLKAHYAPEFYACLLNNQPMGFYSSDTLIKDARRHGVKTKPVDVMWSEWDCVIEDHDTFPLTLTLSTREPSESPQGFGVRQSSAAFERGAASESARGLAHSKTLARVSIAPCSAHAQIFTWPFSVNLMALPTTLKSTWRRRTSSSIKPRGSLGSISVSSSSLMRARRHSV